MDNPLYRRFPSATDRHLMARKFYTNAIIPVYKYVFAQHHYIFIVLNVFYITLNSEQRNRFHRSSEELNIS